MICYVDMELFLFVCNVFYYWNGVGVILDGFSFVIEFFFDNVFELNRDGGSSKFLVW